MKRLFLIPFFMLFIVMGCANQTEEGNQDTENIADAEIYGIDDITINLGDEFDPREGVTAKDEANDLTGSFKVVGEVDPNTPGTYELTYRVRGTNDEIINRTRTVIVESQAPVITVEKQDVTIIKGEDYDLLTGVTVEDDYDEGLEVMVSDDDGFNKDVVGTYIIEYQATDSEGHTSTATRTITVEESATVSK